MTTRNIVRAVLRLALGALLLPMAVLLTTVAAYVGYISWLWRQAGTLAMVSARLKEFLNTG